MSRPRARVTAFAAALVAVAIGVAGCGSVGHSSGSGDRALGKELFTKGVQGAPNCGSCHTLADAGTRGTVGPNLDDAFRQARVDGIPEETFVQVVLDQIYYPIEETSTGAPGMPDVDKTLPECNGEPSDRCVENQKEAAQAIASYVAGVTGTGAKPAPAPAPGGGGAVDGKQVFASAGCASCHTLKDAGSTGTVGPNLDQAKPTKALAVERVTNGRGAMPPFKGQLSEAQIEAVAEYVSSVAGK
jgi:mono/diheme cytochrome c family protein